MSVDRNTQCASSVASDEGQACNSSGADAGSSSSEDEAGFASPPPNKRRRRYVQNPYADPRVDVLMDQCQEESLEGAHILLQTDNRTLVAYIRNEGGTRSLALLELTGRVLELTEQLNITLSACYLPGRLNGIADRLSRGRPVPEWHLLSQATEAIFKEWGVPDIDLFASKETAVVRSYATLDSTDGCATFCDAFSLQWDYQMAWVFPPPNLIPRVLAHLNKARGTYVLIAPHWTRCFWHPDLQARALGEPIIIKDLRKTLIDQTTGRVPEQIDKLSLLAWKVGGGQTKYSVHGIKLLTNEDQALLHSLEADLDLDVWQHGSPGLRDAMVMVSPQNRLQFFDELDKNGVTHYIHLSDVTTAFEEYDSELIQWKLSRRNKMVPFDDFPRYAEVDEYIERVAREYPDIVTLVTAGPSYEGRPIKYLKISTSNFNDTSKPVYYLDAMIHAREWVTTPVALYTIHRLVEDLREEDRDLLEDIDWIVMPIVNPDGYEYTHTDQRLWRRTRSFRPEVSSTCYGIDANRNFDVNHNTIGISSNPCSDIYPGVEPFSEVETGYVRDILHDNLDRLQLYMNIHSFGNWVLYGFGDASLPSNVAQIHHVGAAMGAAMDAKKLPQAPYYLVGNSNFLLYGTSGSAQDYGQKIGVPFSYTLELPGYGFDFRVPPQFIGQINEETWSGIAASARLARQYYRARTN
ncbi:carboxypeptidase B-like [Aricia agestis]|uniref:carboxypeptidase B-like n=1 Tax=Aricia agestis TaxID=91739 RepID=UPI001C209E47|nr:carboxypeptidase B-like [Aricia agestis]